MNVIRDRFWIVFSNLGGLDNHSETAEDFQKFLIEEDSTLSLPVATGKKLGFFGWRKYDKLAKEHLKNKDAFANQAIEQYGDLHLGDIWDGNGSNQNAALTVFRHFDSATVVKGLVGDTINGLGC